MLTWLYSETRLHFVWGPKFRPLQMLQGIRITTEECGLHTRDDKRTNKRPEGYATFFRATADVLLHGSCSRFSCRFLPRYDLIVRWVAWLAVFYYGQTKLVRDELVTMFCCCCLELSQGADFTGKHSGCRSANMAAVVSRHPRLLCTEAFEISIIREASASSTLVKRLNLSQRKVKKKKKALPRLR